MKYLLVTLTALLCISCTSIKPVELAPQKLQQKIISQELLVIGEPVKITTINGEIQSFKVTEVTATEVLGDNVQVAIADIIAIETKQFSGGKTTTLVGVTAGTVYAALGMVAFLSIFTDLFDSQ